MSELRIARHRSKAPRLWVGPDGTVVDCDEADRSHSLYVVENSSAFGIPSEFVERLQAFWEDREIPFDYDYVIALAEANGWARTSRDEGDGCGVSAASGLAALRAAQAMKSTGYDPTSISIEIERIRGDVLESRTIALAGEALHRWIGGAAPQGRWQTHRRPLESLTEGFGIDAEIASSRALRP